ncbi:MAG: hypothetical protein WBQ64_01405 [Terriglobales bacterium]|jgi:predicted PhzF superfamily epimerase YddE/YHI9
MACRIECSCSHRSRIFLLLAVGVFLVASAGAQKAARPVLPKYDLQAETKIKGTIEEIKLPPKGSEKEIAHLLVKNGADTVDVYLCPKAFMDAMGMEFSKGDEISLTGSKIKQGEADLVLAREVVKGNDTFALRDAKGNPVWN